VKKLLYSISIFIVICILLLTFAYIFPNNLVISNFKNILPENQRKSISHFLNSTLFLLPNLNKRLLVTEYEIENINNNLFFLQSSLNKNLIDTSETLQNISLNNFYSKEIYNQKNIILGLKKFQLPIFMESGKKARGYLDINNEILIFVRGDGEFYQIKTKKNKDAFVHPIISKIKTNINEIIFDKNFFDNTKSFKYGSFVGVKDLLIHDNKIYFSYLKEIRDECYSVSILEAKLNVKFLNFKEFFSVNECVVTNTRESGYGNGWGLLHSGGRMVIYSNKNALENSILLTTGELQNRPLSQNHDSIFGKILEIDLKTKNFEIFSSGFRNSHGLIYLKEKNIILATEHGPLGGDEINLIKKNQNYGWPISSYGEHYRGAYEKIPIKELNKIAPLHKSHKDFGFVEPVHYFKSPIAPSQIINIDKKFIKSSDDLYFLTSLKAGSLFIVKFDEKYSKIDFLQKIKLNERIRDIIYDRNNNNYLLVFESSGSLGVLYNNQIPYELCLNNFVNFEYIKNIDLVNYKMKNSFENYCKNLYVSKNTTANVSIEQLILNSDIDIKQ